MQEFSELQVVWLEHTGKCKVGGQPHCVRSAAFGTTPGTPTSVRCYGPISRDRDMRVRVPPPPPLPTALQDITVSYSMASMGYDFTRALDKVAAPLVHQLVCSSPGLQSLSISAAKGVPFLEQAMDGWLNADTVTEALGGRAHPLKLLRLEMAQGEWKTLFQPLFGGRVRRLELRAPKLIIERPATPAHSTVGGDGAAAAAAGNHSGGNTGGSCGGGEMRGSESVHICAHYLQFQGWVMHLDALWGTVQRLNVSFGDFEGRPPDISFWPEYGLAVDAQLMTANVVGRGRTLQLLKARIM